MSRTTRPSLRTVQSVDKALGLLWLFEGSRAEMGVSELARAAGLSPSNVSRLLSSLVRGDLLEYNEVTGRYRLGNGLLRLAALVTDRFDLRALSRPHLERLVLNTQETASLNIFAGGNAVTIDFVPSPLAVSSLVQLGRRGLAHCTSVGKLLLAFQGEALWDEALSAPLPRFTARTVVDHDVLRAEFRRIRHQGYAVAQEEREAELNAIAVPVRGARDTVVAALGLQGPAHRFTLAAMLHALPALQHEAHELSCQLGVSAPAQSRP